MEIAELIKFYEQQVVDSKLYADQAVAKGDGLLAAQNMRSHFLERLALGLIRWRLGESPVEDFRHGLKALLRDRKVLLDGNFDHNPIRTLPLDQSIYVAFLLDEKHPALELADCDKYQVMNAYLGNVLIGAASVKDWHKFSNGLPSGKRYALARDSMILYARLLAGEVTAEVGVADGETLFKKRMNDAYHQGGPVIEGGGKANERSVDFRLAAVLKKIGSTVPTVHAWRW